MHSSYIIPKISVSGDEEFCTLLQKMLSLAWDIWMLKDNFYFDTSDFMTCQTRNN